MITRRMFKIFQTDQTDGKNSPPAGRSIIPGLLKSETYFHRCSLNEIIL